MKKVKLAQIGCGYWGPNLIRAFQSLQTGHLQCIVETSSERQLFLRSQFPQIEVIANWETLASDPTIDAVILATPAHTHYELAKQLLLSGKHVFVEKPLATTSEEALTLCELAESRKQVLMVGHTFLYHSAIRYLKDHLASIGQLYYCNFQRLNLGRLRSDVNAWWNLAPHDVSILLYLTNGDMPVSIAVFGTSYLQQNIEDVVFAFLRWANGMTATIQVSWLDPEKVRKITLVGSEKMIVFDDMQKEKIIFHDKGIDISRPQDNVMHYDQPPYPSFSYRTGDIFIPKVEATEPLKEEAQHFIDCILRNQRCLTDARHGCDVVRILEAGQKSLKNNGIPEPISAGTYATSIR